MTMQRFVCLLFAFVLARSAFAAAQDAQAAPSMPSQGINVDVAVETKSGQPVPGLAQHDFTVLDNKTARPITSFKVTSVADEPVHVILLLDAVNMPFQAVSYTRDSVKKYLKSNEGKLAYPTNLAILTDQGAQIVPSFSTDGNALNDMLQSQQIGLREINRNSEWSGPERLQICLNAFHQLATFASSLPGRKVVIWISPGWPLVSGPRMDLSSRQEQQIFDTVVSISNQLRQNELTIYNVNPWGVGESLDRADLFQAFLKAPAKPNDAEFGNLGLQVIAIHSGGLVQSSSDVAGSIERCLAELRSWYQITFDPLPADNPNEYHHIEVRLDQRNMTAHTTDGYYANPKILEPQR